MKLQSGIAEVAAFSCSSAASVVRNDAYLLKQVMKLIGRIERILIPPSSLVSSPLTNALSEFSKIVQSGKYFCNSLCYKGKYDNDNSNDNVSSNGSNNIGSNNNSNNNVTSNGKPLSRITKWDEFEKDLYNIISQGNDDYVIPYIIQQEIFVEKNLQADEEHKLFIKENLGHLQDKNGQPTLPGRWRKEPYPQRSYEKLDGYIAAPCSSDESKDLYDQLDTPLDGFLGQAYNYDDHDLTEEWMVTFKDGASTAPTDTDVIRTQVESLMEILSMQVQDRVCNETGVLRKEPLGLGSCLKESLVWGIDSYTRKMIELVIDENIDKSITPHNEKLVQNFIERRLLPTINAQSPEQAHNITCSLQSIINEGNDVEVAYCNAVLQAINEFSLDLFRIHPKGTGIICTSPTGINPHVMISEYLGEMYSPYRWCERLDVIQQSQELFGLKPALPDFYNILLERPRQDPRGYGLVFVDASMKANMGSSCSHSCDANCTTSVVARNGKLTICLTTNRFIHPGEELNMDYYSITTSEVEWRAAICLCGSAKCRGSFLNYATQDDLQQVLNQNCGPLWRYASLLRGCVNKSIVPSDNETLENHGMREVALGPNPPSWMKKYAADNLRFLEYERKALPCALMRPRNGMPSQYNFSCADMDARVVMEQRLQSLVCCFSMIRRVLEKQENQDIGPPLKVVPVKEAIQHVWENLSVIPDMMRNFMLEKAVGAKGKGKGSKNGSSNSLDHLVSTSADESAKKKRIAEAISGLKEILATTPSTLLELRKQCLSAREIIRSIEDLSSADAKLTLLADVLVLYAYTSNYSRVQEYAPVESDVFTVVARELGTNIPRSKLFKPEKTSKRLSKGSNGDDRSILGEKFNLNTLNEEKEIKSDQDNVDIENKSIPMVIENDSTPPVADSESKENGKSKPKSKKDDGILKPNEPVNQGTKTYDPMFTFNTLMGWYKAGTDEKVTMPDLLGCVQLPEPAACFGVSESQYSNKQRELLLSHLKDEKAQMGPWPSSLQACFSKEYLNKSNNKIYGSPVLDVALGQIDTVRGVLRELIDADGKNGRGKNKSNDEKQFDEILPPEMPTAWVQCEGCHKWRRVAWHVDSENLPDPWYCNMNDWDPEKASCDTAQDYYDPESENALDYKAENFDESQIVEGTWLDVYCKKNCIYYEAQVKKIKEPKNANEKRKYLFHFKGWSSKFDEWVEAGSDRIQAHNLYTDPTKSHPADQERWQGATVLSEKKSKKGDKKKSDIVDKTTTSKKRKSTGTIAKKSKKANNGKERFSTGDIVESSKMQTEVDDKNDDDNDEDDEDLFPSEMLNA